MGVKDRVEACGRCAMSVAVDNADGEGNNPFDAEDVIEVDEEAMRAVSKHVVVLGDLKERLNEWATDLTYGRR